MPTRTWDGLVVSLSVSDKQTVQKLFADIFMNDLILFFEGRDQISANSTRIQAPPNPEQTVQEVQSRRQHYAQDDATLFARGHMANMTWAELWGFAVYRIVRAIEDSDQVTFPTWQGRSTPAATSASKAIDSDEKKLRYAYPSSDYCSQSAARVDTSRAGRASSLRALRSMPRPRHSELRIPRSTSRARVRKHRKKQKKAGGDSASKALGSGSDEEHNQQEQDKALGLTAKGETKAGQGIGIGSKRRRQGAPVD